MLWVIAQLLLIGEVFGGFFTDRPQRSLHKSSAIRTSSHHNIQLNEPTARTTAVHRPKFSSLSTYNYDGRAIDGSFVSGTRPTLLVVRMQFPDLPFTAADIAFNYTTWYHVAGGKLGTFIAQNSLNRVYFDQVNYAEPIHNSTFNFSSLVATIQAMPGGWAVNQQLFANAIVNEALAYADQVHINVYSSYAIHIPVTPQCTFSLVGKGFLACGAGTTYLGFRYVTVGIGQLFGMNTGGLLRLPPSTSSSSKWAVFPMGDSASALGMSTTAALNDGIFYPVHELVRVGWLAAGDYLTVTTSGTYRLFAHNTAANGPYGIKIGNLTNNTWWIQFTDTPLTSVGATLYLYTGDPVMPYVQIDPTPSSDSCPECATLENCNIALCSGMRDTVLPTTGTTYDAKSFTVYISASAGNANSMYVDVTITFNNTERCPLVGHYGSDCETSCFGGIEPCGGLSQGTCATGPNATTGCTCKQGFLGLGCESINHCDIDLIGSRDPSRRDQSYAVNTTITVETASDITLIGREGHIDEVTVMGYFVGASPHVPAGGVRVTLYSSTALGEVGSVLATSTILPTNVNGDTITVTAPILYGASEIFITLGVSNPIRLQRLIPGTYWISVIPIFYNSGYQFQPDVLKYASGRYDVTRTNGSTWTLANGDARIFAGFESSSCIEWFKPLPNMKTLLIKAQFTDFLMSSADSGYNYLGLLDGNVGTFANFLTQSSEGTVYITRSSPSYTTAHADFTITPLLNISAPLSSFRNTTYFSNPANLSTLTHRKWFFDAIVAAAVQAARDAGFDTDYYDVHFGFFPQFGDNSFLYRPYPSTKGVWISGPNSTNLNSMITAFGYVLGLPAADFLRPDPLVSNDYLRIPSGDSIDPMGWAWKAANWIAMPTEHTDYNVADKVLLGWIANKTTLSHGTTPVWKKLYAVDEAVPGVLKAINLTEPGAHHAFWLQYLGTAAVADGLTVIFTDDYGVSTLLDGTPSVVKCPDCSDPFSWACLACDLRNTSVPIGATFTAGYATIYVNSTGTDANGDFISIQISWVANQLCPMPNYYGSDCSLQCPGGSMNACSGHGSCSTGPSGSGLCTCNSGWTGNACQHPNTCGIDSWGPNLDAHNVHMAWLPTKWASNYYFGIAADFTTSSPTHISNITVYGYTPIIGPNGTDYILSKPVKPSMVRVTVYSWNTSVPSRPGKIWAQSNETDIVMIPSNNLMNPIAEITIRVNSLSPVAEQILPSGSYWLELEFAADPYLNLVVSTNARQGLADDLFIDPNMVAYNAVGYNGDWIRTKDLTWQWLYPWAALELKFDIEFTRCLPSFPPEGIPLPTSITTSPWYDFNPKEAIAGETLTFTFDGFIPSAQNALVRIANPDQGYLCPPTSAPGGEARALDPVSRQVSFVMSTPGYYEVCIQPAGDISWQKFSQTLHVLPYQPQDNYFGFATCAALVSYNTTVCGCMYSQPDPNGITPQVPIVLPMDIPFDIITDGAMPVIVRQGCCTYQTDTVLDYPFIEDGVTLGSSGKMWRLCKKNVV